MVAEGELLRAGALSGIVTRVSASTDVVSAATTAAAEEVVVVELVVVPAAVVVLLPVVMLGDGRMVEEWEERVAAGRGCGRCDELDIGPSVCEVV